MSIRVALVDDHKIFLSGLAQLLNKTDGIEIVGSAADGMEALNLVESLRPEVVVLDISMPQINGIELARQLLEKDAGLAIVCLSMHEDVQLIESMLKTGARAYLLKDCELSELLAAITAAQAGDTYVSPSVGKLLAESLRVHEAVRPKGTLAGLTEREIEVLTMLADGLTTKQVAGKLGLSIKTVGTYREQLMKKLKLRSIAGLTKYAVRAGLSSIE